MKNKILIETFGNLYRLSLPVGASEQDKIQFANLAWLCGSQDRDGEDIESFCTTRAQLHKANRAFRIALTGQAWHGREVSERWLCLPPRKRGVFEKSGFRFARVSQRASRGGRSDGYRIGNADNSESDVASNVWRGYRSQAEKVFDKVA